MELNCRACLQVGDFMVSLFEQVDQFQMSIKELLENIGELEINSDDELPKYVCADCVQELLAAASFRKKCQESSSKLIVLMKRHKTKKEFLKENYQIDEATETAYKTENLTSEDGFYLQKNVENEFSTSMEVKDTATQDDELCFEENEITTSMESNDATNDTANKDLTNEIKKLENELLGVEELPHACYFCGAAYQRVSFLQRHMEREHDVMAACCKKCNRIFKNQEDLKNHACKIFNGYFSKKFVCIFCDKNNKNEIELKEHQKMHTGERPYQCYCGKTFKTRPALVTHRSRHEDPNSRKLCNICNVLFEDQHKLAVHMLTHVDAHPYICWICRRSFSTEDSLESHMKQHYEAPQHPFKCTVCACPFAQIKALENHMEWHISQGLA